MIKVLAVFITLVATSMTAVAAFDRGGTMVDKTLLVAMSVVIVLAVHLLPAISRRPISWVVWTGCLVCAVYGHLTFLTHASLRAGEAQAQQSVLAVGTENQVKTVQEALDRIKARSVSEITAQLSQESDRRVRSHLREELTEAKKAEGFRDELIRLSQVSTTAQIDGAADPVTAKLAAFLGVTDGAIAVVVGLIFSMLMELIGALVWVEALRPSVQKSTERAPVTPVTLPVTKVVTPAVTQSKSAAVSRPVTPVTDAETQPVTPVTNLVTFDVTEAASAVTNSSESNATQPDSLVTNKANSNEISPVTLETIPQESNVTIPVIKTDSESNSDDITVLKRAIQLGKCTGTVAGIRKFFGCSQGRAQELGRELRGGLAA